MLPDSLRVRRVLRVLLVLLVVGALAPAGQPLARAASELQQATSPTTLVATGVDALTLNSARLTWLTRAYCPPNNPAVASAAATPAAAADPVLISRIPSYGGQPRVLFSQNDPRQPGVCNPYNVRSNIVADAEYIYWVVGQQLYRLSVNANPGDAPEPWGSSTIFGDRPVELVIAGDMIISMTQFTDAIAFLRFISRADGTSTGTGVAARAARSLGYDGKYYYYLTDTQLRRALPGEQAFTAIVSPVTVGPRSFPPLNYYVAEVPGGAPLLYYQRGNFVDSTYTSTVNQIYAYITASNITSPFPIHNTPRQVSGLFSDGTYVFTLETRDFCSNPQPQCFADRYQRVLLRTRILYSGFLGYYGDTPEQLYGFDGVYTNGFIASDSLMGDGTFLYWRENSGIKRLPADVAGIPLVNMAITGMEVTQGIQSLSNSVPLIQNRRTFVRVYVRSGGAAIPGVTALLVGTWNNGNGSGGALAPVNAVGTRITVNPAPSRNNLDDSFLFELPWEWTRQSDLRLRAILNPYGVPIETDTADNDVSRGPFRFQPSPRLQVQFVAWGYTINNVTYYPRFRDDIVQTYSWIRRTYPLASTPGFWAEPSPGFRPNVWLVHDDGLGARVNRTHKDCSDNLCASAYSNSRLKALRAEEGIADDIFMYGMISDAAGWFPRGQEGGGGNVSSGPTGVPGNTLANEPAGNNTAVGGWDSDTSYGDWYAGHEIGHSLGRPHPSSGSDNPNTASSENCGHSRSGDTSSEHGNLTSARAPIGPADDSVAGFDFGDPEFRIQRAVLPSATWNDMMSYCANQWISDYTYNAIYNKLMGLAALQEGQLAQAQRPAQVSGDWLSVFGTIAADTLSADIHHLRRRASVASVPARTPGAYSIRLIGAGGAQLADYPFTPESADDGEALGFGQVVPFVAGARAVQIVRLSDGRMLAEQAVSASVPSVTNVRLENAPSPVQGTVTLAWDASDPDGDSLDVDIFYRRASGEFQPLLLGVSGNSAAIDTARLGGGDAVLRVVVSDGVHSAQAETPPLVVAVKAPEPQIISPADGTRLQWGQLLNLSGEAADAQDGGVAESGLAWSNQYGPLGSGSLLTLHTLPAGPNVITLTATNSAGVSSSTSVTVFVDDELRLPGPTPAFAPGQVGWSVSAGSTGTVSATLSLGNSGGGELRWAASSADGWLTLDAASGSAPASLTLTADPSGIPADTTARTKVILSFSDGANNPLGTFEIPVTLSVGDAFNGGLAGPGQAPAGGSRLYLPLLRR